MALPDAGYEQHLADLATAWIEDHPEAAARALEASAGWTVLRPAGPECPHCDLPKDHEGECVPMNWGD